MTLISQYNPHGVFVALEDGGYFVIPGSSRLSKAARYAFLLGGLLGMAALPIFTVLFGVDLDYRYEVAAISVDWLTLIVGGAVLTEVFRRPMEIGS